MPWLFVGNQRVQQLKTSARNSEANVVLVTIFEPHHSPFHTGRVVVRGFVVIINHWQNVLVENLVHDERFGIARLTEDEKTRVLLDDGLDLFFFSR